MQVASEKLPGVSARHRGCRWLLGSRWGGVSSARKSKSDRVDGSRSGIVLSHFLLCWAIERCDLSDVYVALRVLWCSQSICCENLRLLCLLGFYGADHAPSNKSLIKITWEGLSTQTITNGYKKCICICCGYGRLCSRRATLWVQEVQSAT